MPDVTIIKLKIRRGTDAQRRTVTLEQGELGYTTDNRRVFVGDGATLGGVPVGSVVHTPVVSVGGRVSVPAVQNDLIYEQGTLLYQLTGSDYTVLSAWGFVGSRTDNTTLEYSPLTKKLRLKDEGVQGRYLNSNAAKTLGGLAVDPLVGMYADVDNSTLTISASNKLQVAAITEDEISSGALGAGLQGGSGTKVSIKAGSHFRSDTSIGLSLTSLPDGTVNVNTLSAASIGNGLNIGGGKLRANIETVNSSLEINAAELSIKPVIAAGSVLFRNFTYNQYGQIIETSTISGGTLSGIDPSVGSMFSGELEQDTYFSQTIISTVSSNASNTATEAISLSSAGFICLVSSDFSRIAIPIFKY